MRADTQLSDARSQTYHFIFRALAARRGEPIPLPLKDDAKIRIFSIRYRCFFRFYPIILILSSKYFYPKVPSYKCKLKNMQQQPKTQRPPPPAACAGGGGRKQGGTGGTSPRDTTKRKPPRKRGDLFLYTPMGIKFNPWDVRHLALYPYISKFLPMVDFLMHTPEPFL